MRVRSSVSRGERMSSRWQAVIPLVIFCALGGLAACGDHDTERVDSTTTALPPEVRAQALWPDVESVTRFDDPVEAARSFAVDLVGFTDPVLGEFRQGDSRSGEVELQPRAGGPVSIVLLRQLAPDETWWVLAAVHEDIVIEKPQPRSVIDHPLRLSGRARAFEGTVQVSILADGSPDPIGEGFVTGSGGLDLGPFDGEIPFQTPQVDWGALVLYTESAEDGSVWAVTAIRVGFLGDTD